MRAIAVIIVFVGHGFNAPGWFPGHVGVTLFFFLSGYLIVTLLRREYAKTATISLTKFYTRRALRILPPAYLAIAASVALAAMGLLPNPGGMTGWGLLAEALSYTNYYIVTIGRDGLPPETTMLWSLGVEEHYYLLIPALILFLFKRKLGLRGAGWVLVWAAIAIMLWRVVLAGNGAGFDRLYISSDTRIDSLLWGSALALLWNPVMGDDKPRPLRKLNLWWATIPATGVFLCSAVVPSIAFRLVAADTIQCLCLVVIFWWATTQYGSPLGKVLNHPWMVRVGVWSFSIYLFHRMALEVIHEHFGLGPLATDLLALLVSCGIAELIRIGVEGPLGKLRKRLHA